MYVCMYAAHILVVMQKSLEKTVLNEEIPVNKYQKKINHIVKVDRNDVHYS